MLLLVHSRLSRRMVKRLRVPLKTVMETDVDVARDSGSRRFGNPHA